MTAATRLKVSTPALQGDRVSYACTCGHGFTGTVKQTQYGSLAIFVPRETYMEHLKHKQTFKSIRRSTNVGPG